MTTKTILLGPQRAAPTVRDALDSLGVPGDAPVAAVTAGWEEREAEDLELGEHLGGRVVNLRIYQRGDDVYHRDPELHEAMRERHDTLRKLQDIYRLRLSHALEAARELLAMEEDERLMGPEREAAIEAVRELDRHHLQRVSDIHEEFDERWRPAERDTPAHHRHEIGAELEGAAAVCIAGGHVAILLNRMRLFDLAPLLANRPVVAWSAGAMAMSEKIVLFHDSPPQGAGDPEILVPALARCKGVVPLPHAKRRLRLGDRTRVELLARRFHEDLCAALDERCRIDWDGERWTGGPGTRKLCGDGSLREVSEAC